MDLWKMFTINTVIHFLLYVKADQIFSSLLDSAEDIRCTEPFLSLFTIGYIQCQRACIRYPDCEVLRYNKSDKDCFLHFITGCEAYSGPSDSNIYKRRDTIHQSIGGYCLTSGCPTKTVRTTCVVMENGNKCLIDLVLSHNALHNTVYVDVDGVYFGIYPGNMFDSELFCNQVNGRLAVLDTPRKRQILSTETRRLDAVWGGWVYLVGARFVDKRWIWSNGVSATLDTDGPLDYHCVTIKVGILTDVDCGSETRFICEIQ